MASTVFCSRPKSASKISSKKITSHPRTNQNIGLRLSRDRTTLYLETFKGRGRIGKAVNLNSAARRSYQASKVANILSGNLSVYSVPEEEANKIIENFIRKNTRLF